MRVVIDTETNSLDKPTEIWCIVCRDIDTGQQEVFRNVTSVVAEKERFLTYANTVSCWIGHSFLAYDYPTLHKLIGLNIQDVASSCIDTLIISKLVDYSRPEGHSIESYGKEFKLEKGIPVGNELLPSKFFPIWFFQKWSQDLENYCVRDVEICEKIYHKYLRIINDPDWQPSIRLEHSFQLICNDLHNNGFSFNAVKAKSLLEKITQDLAKLDEAILKEFLPREVLIREFTPKATKFGTINKTSVPRSLWENMSSYSIGETYRHTRVEPFNPSSHKQIINILNEAGWKPEEKTKTHVETERELQRLKYSSEDINPLDIKLLSDKLIVLKNTGWKINEHNLGTLPVGAPAPAKTLAKRILLESRRRTLTEWLGLVTKETGRIHGKFYGIGAWTHRMAHQQPNTANIPNDKDTNGKTKLLGKELRSLWQAPHDRLLVGVDAEGIQLRIFAHYIDDREFTKALVEGKKENKSDPHSLNQRILGPICKSRAAAKRTIYALLLGAGMDKLVQILEASKDEVKDALDRLLERYQGFAYLKKNIIPTDGRRGWFQGLDGRKIRIPGETASSRSHLSMSGYLQSGEAIVMKKACVKWSDKLKEDKALLVNFIHDEWQTECPNDMEISLKIAKLQSDSLREVGEELNLKCPLAGSYYNDDYKDYTISTNWNKTH